MPFSFPVHTLLEEWQFTHQGGLTCLTISQNVFMAPVSVVLIDTDSFCWMCYLVLI